MASHRTWLSRHDAGWAAVTKKPLNLLPVFPLEHGFKRMLRVLLQLKKSQRQKMQHLGILSVVARNAGIVRPSAVLPPVGVADLAVPSKLPLLAAKPHKQRFLLPRKGADANGLGAVGDDPIVSVANCRVAPNEGHKAEARQHGGKLRGAPSFSERGSGRSSRASAAPAWSGPVDLLDRHGWQQGLGASGL